MWFIARQGTCQYPPPDQNRTRISEKSCCPPSTSADRRRGSHYSVPVFLEVAFGQASVFKVRDFSVAEWAVFQLEVLQLLVQSLVFANLASVVFLLEDTHATSNAR